MPIEEAGAVAGLAFSERMRRAAALDASPWVTALALAIGAVVRLRLRDRDEAPVRRARLSHADRARALGFLHQASTEYFMLLWLALGVLAWTKVADSAKPGWAAAPPPCAVSSCGIYKRAALAMCWSST